jgi:hypothetical protein
MTDPERISKRSFGLAAQLLQAGGDEQPGAAGIERTLAALGVSGALLTTAAAAGASAAGVAGSGAKVVTATLLAKWIGVGVLGGVTLSGAAALLSEPAAPASPQASQASQASAALPQVAPVAAPPSVAAPPVEMLVPALAESAAAVAAPVVAPSQALPTQPLTNDVVVEVGAPLAAEVTFIDGARALLASGQAEQGLSQLRRYEQEFPEARLLPEVLFLRMETCDRLGRSSEARAAATRLVRGFAHSPHAARARKLLER